MMFRPSKPVLVSTILVLLVIAGAATFYISRNTIAIPSDATVQAHADMSSAAASRSYEGTITLIHGSAIQGTETYVSDATGGNHAHSECVIANGNWVDTTTKTSCSIPSYLATTSALIAAQISSSALVPESECKHMQVCYMEVR